MKNLVFQSKYRVFCSKTLDFDQNTSSFDLEFLKDYVFYTLNLKYCNPGHNILELYSILVQIRFTTSKTKLDI